MTRSRQHGFTLIELIIFIVVVGAGLAGILSVMNTVVKSSADPMVRKQSIAIAESLLEEILLKDFADPNGGVGCAGGVGNRVDWDDVCDYRGYTSATIVDLTGTAVPGLTSYRIAPAVAVAQQASGSSDLTGVAALKVTVSVTNPQGEVVSLTGYRARDQ